MKVIESVFRISEFVFFCNDIFYVNDFFFFLVNVVLGMLGGFYSD